MNEYIYALYTEFDGDRQYFYVGRSQREPGIRFKEHSRNALDAKRTEDVYAHIRENATQCGIQFFEEEILCWSQDDKPEDYEDMWVIKMIKDGYELKNMKHGDQKKIAALQEIAKEDWDVSTVKNYRKAKERKAYERSEALRNKVRDPNAVPMPENALSKFLREAKFQAASQSNKEYQAEKRRKANKKEAAKIAREQEHQKWLAEQRHLFEDARK